MVEGQVSYHRPENVKRLLVEKNNTIVRQLEKTKTEAFPNLAQLQQDRHREIALEQKQQQKQQQKQAAKEQRLAAEEAKRRAEELSYDRVFQQDMTSNADVKATVDASAAEEYEDDFF